MKMKNSCNGSTYSDQDKREKAYLAALDKKLKTLVDSYDISLEEVISKARGAFPTVVLRRLQELRLDKKIKSKSEISSDDETSFNGPELHPLDFEWYFTPKSADDLASILSSPRREILCLSSPTVAASIAHRQHRAVLVDRNPLILNRLTKDLPFFQFLICDLLKHFSLKKRFPVVFFDAPWYLEFTSLWLRCASQAVRPGGLLAFILFPSLIRPGAEHERLQLLEHASTLGRIEIIEESMSYETPLFEREALAHSGLQIANNWRRADLVLVHVNKIPRFHPSITIKPEEKWDSFVIGKQVIKLRKSVRSKDEYILAPLAECPDYVLPSVSRRDSRRDKIELWTSRNRVAQVGNSDLVSAILENLKEAKCLDDVMKLSLLNSISIDERKKLVDQLKIILRFD